MNKYLKSLLIILVIGIAIFLFLNRKTKPDYFKKVDLNEANQILNNTDKPYLDTIVSVGLDQLGIDSVDVLIYPLSETARKNFQRTSGGDLDAHIRENNGIFYVFLNSELSRSEMITVLSHELIHLKQYHEKRVIYKDDTIIWMGIKYKLSQIAYDDRPWENEAFIKQNDLADKIEMVLYN